MAFGKFGKYYPGGAEVRPEPFDLIGALREDFARIRANEGRAHDMQFMSQLAALLVRTDRLHVHYITMNLLLNAVKYSPVASRVELAIEHRSHCTTFAVADQGIGIPEAEVDAIFSPFFRASNVGGRPGTGMGLAIVKKSAQLIGAQLAVETAATGTRLTVLLPPQCVQPRTGG